ncbi:MAG: 23S rRNA (pseudouridine(1915)-N(3))-methyltransferase RlmH, partial [Bdellovibrionales bacterium]|nr:23S rRNA (pseudouridine(1915)-N(3))-methyltransferase RlmH [Bdellovibrionales bacterium]
PGNSFKIILDETGKLFTSKDLAEFIQQKQISSVTHLCFAIGGAAGWDPSVLKNSDLTLSLSKLTFPHQIARILLVEQIYRARSILKGTNYHK